MQSLSAERRGEARLWCIPYWPFVHSSTRLEQLPWPGTGERGGGREGGSEGGEREGGRERGRAGKRERDREKKEGERERGEGVREEREGRREGTAKGRYKTCVEGKEALRAHRYTLKS